MPSKNFFKKNVLNVILITGLLVLLFVPPAKAFLLRGLMEIGLFKPSLAEKQPAASSLNLAAVRFSDAKGKVIDLQSLKGKVVFLNFWATWCPPCQAEMPSINKLYLQFKADPNVVFIMVDADSDLPKAQKFLNKKNYAMPVYAVAGDIPEQLFKGSLPTTVVFDKQGRISYNEEGAANYAHKKFVAFIEQLRDSKE